MSDNTLNPMDNSQPSPQVMSNEKEMSSEQKLNPYEEAIKRLAFKCVQWGDGEVTGYDNRMMDSLLPIIMKPLYNKFEDENASLRAELAKQKELKDELVNVLKMVNGLIDAHDLGQYIPQGNIDAAIRKQEFQ